MAESINEDDEDYTVGGVAPEKPKPKRISMVIWGPSGIGKTTLAATMPGRKALINFDPDGPSSIPNRDDVTVFDLSTIKDSWVAKFKDEDPLNIERHLHRFDSIIVDSMSTLTEKTLARGITQTKGATVERPSPGAYMARNNLAITFVRNMLSLTAKYDKHICFIAHEGAPDKTEEGNIINYTMSLGGQLPGQMALRINECWPMFEDGKNRKMIICRKARLRDPAKSRMFATTPSNVEFEWKFDPEDFDNPNNMTIADWYNQWVDGGFVKLPLPK